MNLDLKTKYFVIDKKYIPIEQSGGAYCCDNCGKIIANIATVSNESNKKFNIGFDCLETILINNGLLSLTDVENYNNVKKMVPKIIRFSKHLKELITLNNGLDGFLFEPQNSDWLTFYLLKGNQKPYNTNVKLKEVDFKFLIETLKHILPNHKIEVKQSN